MSCWHCRLFCRDIRAQTTVNSMNEIFVKGSDLIIVAIVVLWVGDRITEKIAF